MQSFPDQILPKCTDEVLQNTLFHYTTAEGLMGILKNNSIWCTAHYCTNDETELQAVRDFLTPLFRNKTYELKKENNHRVDVFNRRGVDIMDYANQFEHQIISFLLHRINVYLTSFCKPNGELDFLHGLLSQWRGYGDDGGYALQINRERLVARIDEIKTENSYMFDLQDVRYSENSSLKTELELHSEAFVKAYLDHLDFLVDWKPGVKAMPSPIVNLHGGPLESLFDYLICTKNEHFREERECRLSILDISSEKTLVPPVDYFSRNGLIIPFTKTPTEFNILECVDWIIVGPSPRIGDRFNAIRQMVSDLGLDIQVRASNIPFSRQ